MNGTANAIAPGLLDVAERVWISADRTEATVDGRKLEADDPRELRRLLVEAFYETLHAGQSLEKGTLPIRIRDAAFESLLDAGVPHRETTVPVLLCPHSEKVSPVKDHVLVRVGGLRVWVPDSALSGEEKSPGSVTDLTMTARRPALSPGFFLVDGTRLRPPGRDILRVYVHLESPDAAVTVWPVVLNHLEERGAGYRAKILSTPALYPRRDALVVYLADGDGYTIAGELAGLVDGLPGVGDETSLFADRLCAGVAAAWEPADPRPGMQGLSFGQHRAGAVAEAFLQQQEDGAFEHHLAHKLIEANIDPARPARNLTSPTISAKVP